MTKRRHALIDFPPRGQSHEARKARNLEFERRYNEATRSKEERAFQERAAAADRERAKKALVAEEQSRARRFRLRIKVLVGAAGGVRQAAKVWDIPHTVISDWVNREAEPRRPHLDRLAARTQCSLDWLFGYEGVAPTRVVQDQANSLGENLHDIIRRKLVLAGVPGGALNSYLPPPSKILDFLSRGALAFVDRKRRAARSQRGDGSRETILARLKEPGVSKRERLELVALFRGEPANMKSISSETLYRIISLGLEADGAESDDFPNDDGED